MSATSPDQGRALLISETRAHLAESMKLPPGAPQVLARHLVEDFGVHRCSNGELVTAGGQSIVDFVTRHLPPGLDIFVPAPSKAREDLSGLTATQRLGKANGDTRPKL